MIKKCPYCSHNSFIMRIDYDDTRVYCEGCSEYIATITESEKTDCVKELLLKRLKEKTTTFLTIDKFRIRKTGVLWEDIEEIVKVVFQNVKSD